ncbi:hypothetical protein ACLB2K_049392 [Fragaria x ananassa]
MCSLEHLELSISGTTSRITDIGGVGIAAIRTLKKLTLNFLDVSDTTMVALAQNCRNLEILDIGGCDKVTVAGICAFCCHKCLKCLVLDELKINLSDVERIVFGCLSLKSVVVDHRRRLDPTWSDELMHEKTRKVVNLDSALFLLLLLVMDISFGIDLLRESSYLVGNCIKFRPKVATLSMASFDDEQLHFEILIIYHNERQRTTHKLYGASLSNLLLGYWNLVYLKRIVRSTCLGKGDC